MKLAAKYCLVFTFLWMSKGIAQFQGFDILLPTIANQIQSIQNGDYVAQNMITIKPNGIEEVHLTPLIAGTDQVHLYIDPSIVIPFPYSNNSNITGTPPNTNIVRVLDFNLPLGKTQATYNVNMLGTLNYQVPITCAPGTKGIEPHISIDYNSLNTNGLVGYGWNISGIENISRVGQTLYHNNNIKGVSLTNDDWFAYNGNRLVTVSGQNGASNTEYRTESETFAKVTSFNTIGSGPEWFKVETKEGMMLEFGNTPDSRHIPDGQNTTLTWMINKIQDNYGNYVTFKYHNANGENYIEEINYTGNQSANILPYNQIKFYYDNREDQTTSYLAGGKIKTTVVLREIEIFSEGISFKKYDFNYSYNNVYSFLNEIIEQGADRSHFNSLLFSYQDDDNSTQPLTQTASLNNSDSYFKAYIPVDVNEDGKSDLLRLSYNDPTDPQPWKSWHIFQNTGSNQFNSIHSSSFPAQDFIRLGFYPFNKTERGNMFFENLDFDGDGKEDLVFLVPAPPPSPNAMATITLHFYLSTNNYAPTQTTLDALGDDPKNIWFLDFNGDQKLDLINLYNLPSNSSSIHNGQAVSRTTVEGWLDIAHYTAGFPDIMAIYYGTVPNSTGGTYNFSNAIISDMNGDGKAEIINISETLNPNSRYVLQYESASNPVSLIADNSGLRYEAGVYNPSNDCLGSSDMSLIGDFNGDLKTDVLAYHRFGPGNSFTWSINYSKGDGTFENTPINNSVLTDPFTVCGVHQLARDLNNDGKTDILEYNYDITNTGLNINILYSDGVTFIKESHNVQVPFSDYALNFGDFNGDGGQDLFIYSQYDVSKSPQIVYFTKGIRSKLIKQAVDGYNIKTEFQIDPISSGSFYTQNGAKIYPLNNMNGPMYVTSKVTRPDGVGGDNITTYSYEDVIMHKTGKGLIGFLKMIEFNNVTKLQTINEYDYNATFFNLIPVKTTTNLIIGQNVTGVSRITYTVNTTGFGGVRFLPALVSSFNEDLISGKELKTDLTYDMYGNNLTKIRNINSGVEIESVTNSYTQMGAWIPSRIANESVAVTRTGQSQYTRSVSYLYNSQDKGQISTMETDIGLRTDYQYNSLTGVVAQKVEYAPSNSTIAPKLIVYNAYDPYFRFAIKSTNSLGQTGESSFDGKWGVILTDKDIDGLSNTYIYDAFGRNTKVALPNGVISTTTYNWIQPGSIPSVDPIDVSDILFSINKQQAGLPESVVFYDAFERERKTQTDGFSDKIYTVIGYDSKSNIAVSSSAYQVVVGTNFRPVLTTFTYDDLNRLIKYEQSNGIISPPLTTLCAYSYSSGNSTIITTEPDNNTKTRTTDATGVLTSVTDYGGTLNYEYFSSRKLKSVSLGGVPVKSYTYDSFGRQTSVSDINSGATDYQYDELNQLISQTDANAHTYTFQYDALGRVTHKNGPDGIYIYQYVSSGNGINQLLQSTAPNGIYNKYSYDNLNRVSKIEKGINGQTFSTSYDYDNYNNLALVSYPSGFSVRRDYTSTGYLSKVVRSDNNQMIWQADEMNPLGLYSKYTLGNGLQTHKSYSDFGFVETVQAGNVQDLHYNIDPTNGNVISRMDGIIGLTESFSYDQLNRLTNSSISGGVQPSQSINYAANGNITQKTDAGSYSYLNSKPNAIESVTNPHGDISSFQQDISYAPFNKASTITEGDYQLAIIYGSDQQRAKSDLFFQGALMSSRYFVGNYEKQVSQGFIQEIHYINAGDGLAAIYVLENGVGNLYYVYKDNLGSVITITDQGGNKIAEQSFDAWGRFRNPNDWSYSSIPPIPAWLYRGFTGHEHLPAFGLINMNGRMYDPILGLMLSPDPMLMDNTNTQAYNGYSYALNNPMKYVDPTGEFVQYIIGAIIGGISGYMIADAYGYKGWDKFWYTLGGAAIGAFTAGFGSGVSAALGIGAGGAIGGAVGGATFGILKGQAAGVRGGDLIESGFNGLWQGGITGFGGALVGGAIGGGWGALAGGATAGGLGTAMSGGSGEDILMGSVLGGVMGWSVYQASLIYSYNASGIKSSGLKYDQFAKMMRVTQRSMFWDREGKFIANTKGGVNVSKLGTQNTSGAMGSDYKDALLDYHTHQDWGSTLADGEGFSTYASGGAGSDEFTRNQLNLIVKFKGPMYLGTREGHIWYMNSNFTRGMLPYNFSSVFTPFNITTAVPFIR